MAVLGTTGTTTTNLDTISSFSLPHQALDEASNIDEVYWYNIHFNKYNGYYKQIPELKKAIDVYILWVCGRGFNVDDLTKIKLEDIKGWGKDTFDKILRNMLAVMKYNGDAYAEIVWDDKELFPINIKPLNPERVRHAVDRNGIIIGYDVWDSGKWKRLPTKKIFHLCNDRVGNEIHGVSIVEACQWVIDARNEAMEATRRMLYRSSIRVMEVDSNDTTKINTLREQYREAIKKGEVLIVPKDNVSFPDVKALSTTELREWINYLGNFFYEAVGIPQIFLGGSPVATEASSKVMTMTFEQPHMAERNYLEKEIWSQLRIKIEFDEPESLMPEMQESEAANTGQMGFQNNEMTAQMGRVE